mgnify:CR=1 FL=1
MCVQDVRMEMTYKIMIYDSIAPDNKLAHTDGNGATYMNLCLETATKNT